MPKATLPSQAQPDHLSTRDEQFASLIAQGHAQSTAYQTAYKPKGLSAQALADRAAKLRRTERVVARIDELLIEARVGDVLKVGRAARQLVDDMNAAREAGNHTALAAYHRVQAAILGLMDRQSINITFEGGLSDDALVSLVSGSDEHVSIAMKRFLGATATGGA